MNKLIIILLTFFSFSALSQKPFALIDHDYRFNRCTNFLATDSLIYYTSESLSMDGPLDFCSIDSTGIIQRTHLRPYNTAFKTKFVNVDTNSFDVLYFDLHDIDILGFGIIELNYRDGEISYRDRLYEYYDGSDMTLTKAGDTLYVLNLRNWSNSSIKLDLGIFDRDDVLIAEVEIPNAEDYKKLIKYNEENLLVISDHAIARLTADYRLDTLFISTDEIQDVVHNSSDVFCRINNRMLNFDLDTRDTTFLFSVSFDDLQTVKLGENQFEFKIYDSSTDLYHIVSTPIIGSDMDTLYTLNDYFSNYQLINNNLYSYRRIIAKEFVSNPVFNFQKLNETDTPSCRDVSIDEVNLYNSLNELVDIDTFFNGTIVESINRTYEYSITISNNGIEDVDSLHIYSDDYYRFLDDLLMPHINETIYNLAANETRVIQGTFGFEYYDHKLDSFRFYIPGADHHLDCTPEDNTYLVSEVTSSIIDQNIQYPRIILYPNPVKETLTIDTDIQYDSFKIFDFTGRLVLERESTNLIDVSMLQDGIHFLSIGNRSVKFIKN